MILLDTNALLWLEAGHKRARPLRKAGYSLYVSPASVLEVQFLAELGRIRWRGGHSSADILEDERFRVDEPPAVRWFGEAATLSWTRDPFDRLIVAHAITRQWKIATGDTTILEHVDPRRAIPL
jgi:PIN domain nuclease of toxin-antitoxin system